MNNLPDDALWDISLAIIDGSTWKVWNTLCVHIHNIASKRPHILRDMANQLITLIKYFPEKPWDWRLLSGNTSITMEFILENYHRLDLLILGSNPALSIDFIIDNLCDFDVYGLSLNPNITMDFVKEHPDIDWHSDTLSCNINMTVEYAIIRGDCNWYELSMNPAITQEIVSNNISQPWSITYLAANPNIRPEFIAQFPNYETNCQHLSYNHHITPEIVNSLPQVNWKLQYILMYSKYAVEFIIRGMFTEPELSISNIMSNRYLKLFAFALATRILINDQRINSKAADNFIRYVPEIESPLIRKIVRANTFDHTQINESFLWRIMSANVPFAQMVIDYPELPWVWSFISRNRFSKKRDEIVIDYGL